MPASACVAAGFLHGAAHGAPFLTGPPLGRFANGPPDIAPPAITDPSVAASQGEATGPYLKARGVNVDLTPVSDVPSADSFLIGQGRGFRGPPSIVANTADAFAQGLRHAGVAACAKHFPGVGALSTDTDFALQRVNSTPRQLAAALVPFQREIRDGIDMIMVANAIYPRDDPSGPAGFSRPIVNGLLRKQLEFKGVLISDALDSPDALPGDASEHAIYAARAGIDIILFKPAEDGGFAYEGLFAAARSGALSRSQVAHSYQRILALKQRVAALQRQPTEAARAVDLDDRFVAEAVAG